MLLSRITLLGWVLFAALVFVVLLPTLALADLSAAPTGQLVLPAAQIWVVVVGLLTPLVAYVLNSHLWASLSEPYKAFIQIVVSAGAAAITTAITTNVLGFNDATLQLIVTSVFASLVAHKVLWVPSGVQARLTRTVPS